MIVPSRTRMWCAGMNSWERVCESQTLAWVYNDVLEHASVDAAGHRVTPLPVPQDAAGRP